jgi:multiple sugar transport system substrate-binding protein
MKRTAILFLSIVVLATASVAAQGKISVMFQATGAEGESFKALFDRFTRDTGIKVEPMFIPHDTYFEKFSANVAAKRVADVMQLDAPFLANFVWNGYLSPLDGLVDAKIIADLTPSSVYQGTYPIDGRLYALGNADSTVLLYGSKKLLKAAGVRIPTGLKDAWTKAEFDAALDKLAKVPGVKWPLDIMRAYGVKTEWATYAFQPVFESFGGKLIDPKTWKASGALDSPESVAAATEIQSWVKKGYVVPASSGTNALQRDQDKCALAWCGNWGWNDYYSIMKDDLVAIPLPNFGKGVKSPNGTWIWAITKSSRNPKAAAKFLNYLATDKQFIKESPGAFPGLKAWAAEMPAYTDPAKMKVAFDQSTVAVPRPVYPGYPVLTASFQTALDNILSGADPKAELTKAAAAIDQDGADHDGYPPFGE